MFVYNKLERTTSSLLSLGKLGRLSSIALNSSEFSRCSGCNCMDLGTPLLSIAAIYTPKLIRRRVLIGCVKKAFQSTEANVLRINHPHYFNRTHKDFWRG